MKTKLYIIAAVLFCTTSIYAKQYYGSLFGMKSDGITVNTGSLQKAIDFISTESPGDTITLWVGRYRCGTIQLKSNVTIMLREGAIISGIESAYDYENSNGLNAIFVADGQENISIVGNGVIEGNGSKVYTKIKEQKDKGYIKSEAEAKPSLIAMNNCKNINIKGIILQNACADAQIFNKCSNILVDGITIFGTDTPDSKGLILNDNNGVKIENCYLQTSGTLVQSNGNSNATINNSKDPSGQLISF